MEVLETAVDCVECGSETRLDVWLDDSRCPECGQRHEVPKLQIVVDAVRSGEVAGEDLVEVVEGFRLQQGEAVDLLMELGCSAAAAVDVDRTVVQGRVRSEWRRLVDRTREEERSSYREAEAVLARFGVDLHPPEE